MSPETDQQLVRIMAEIGERDCRQDEILHADPPQQYKEEWSALAFVFDLTAEELSTELNRDITRFKSIMKIATEQTPTILGWADAVKIYDQRKLKQTLTQDKIYKALNSRFPNYPKPESRFFETRFKRRKKISKKELCQKAQKHSEEQIIQNAFATEQATPIDEFPDLFKD